MAKFIKKPIMVEAIQWTGRNIKEMLSFTAKIIERTSDIDTDKSIIIHTLEGDMKANINDWIIKGIKGEFYPCKPDIFEATYELITEYAEILNLSSSEVLYGFIAWLSSREEQVKLSLKDDANKPLHLVSAFCKENHLPELREGWSKILITPSNK